MWLDTSVTPNRLKRYNGSEWDTVGDMTAGDLLTLLKTVDGSGSGLDADKLDGQEGSYYQNASNLDSGTIPSDRLSANDLLTKVETVDGSGSGLDADKVDGLEASTFVRNDADTDVNAHTEWQDTYQARFGNGADLRIQHSGSSSYIDNYNGDLNIRQLNHGSNIQLQAENASGTMKTLLTVDPDDNAVKIGGLLNLGDPLSQNLTISNGEITVTHSYHRVDTEGGASSDNLLTINGGNAGDILILQSVSAARKTTLKDSSGNLKLSGDFTLFYSPDKIMLIAIDYTSVGGILEWHEVSRSTNGLP